MNAVATVDLVRLNHGRSRQGRWHILRNPQVTLCNFDVPATATVERGFDTHVVQYRGTAVCVRCIGRRQ